jgi:hypothetical protein
MLFYAFYSDVLSAAFGACRQAQRNSVDVVSNCKPGPGGAASKEDATAQLKATSE